MPSKTDRELAKHSVWHPFQLPVGPFQLPVPGLAPKPGCKKSKQAATKESRGGYKGGLLKSKEAAIKEAQRSHKGVPTTSQIEGGARKGGATED